MRKLTRNVPPLLAFALMFAVGICLAAPVSAAQASTTKTATHPAKTSAASKTATSKTAAGKSMAKKKTDALASPEDLTGTITSVDSTGNEITLIGSNGVPYDFDLTRKTHVEASNQKIAVRDLAGENHKQATVHFLPTSRGNLAESIQISAS